MAKPTSPADILKLLKKTNCRECGEPTCLAFAAAVFKGRRNINECPYVDKETLKAHGLDAPVAATNANVELDKTAAKLKKKAAGMDMAATALKAGGKLKNDRLTISVMGKEFSLDKEGVLHSQIHLHSWVTIPLLSYLCYGQGKVPAGQWAAWRELPGGREFEGLYKQRIENALNKVAEEYTDIFEDMLFVFNGRKVDQLFDADISLVLYPLPKIPILVCYWAPEDGLESNLNLYFDPTAVDNMGDINALYTMTAGLASMFEKIAHNHGR